MSRSRVVAQTLFTVGRDVAVLFVHLLRILPEAESVYRAQLPRQKLALEEQRFRLWAGNLGLGQHGHSSLDYRLRDADIVKQHAIEILSGLKEYLFELEEIISNKRLPYELGIASDVDAKASEDDVPHSQMARSQEAYQSEDDDFSSDDNLSAASGEEPFQEVSTRFQGVIERIDNLYSLATKIRNPAIRPVRPTAELYKHCQSDNLFEYIQERIDVETHIARHIHIQHLMQFKFLNQESEHMERKQEVSSDSESSRHQGRSPETSPNSGVAGYPDPFLEPIPQESERSNRGFAVNLFSRQAEWLIQRIGKANARRRQQFVYWREHAELIANIENQPQKPHNIADDYELANKNPESLLRLEVHANLPLAMSQAHSGPTTATLLDPELVKLDDSKSVISHSSRPSTVVGVVGEILSWPEPPSDLPKSKFFICKYCMTICPQQYLNKEHWKNHIIHDLQPYQCTYPDCEQPDRLYASRHEWMKHEGLRHTRVWSCSNHPGEEFEAQGDYLKHLHDQHPDDPNDIWSPELVAACMQPSASPHRSCPLCPTEFETVLEMQNHIGHHLERFALLGMPKISELESEGHSLNGSVKTQEAAMGNLRSLDNDSRADDFDKSRPLKINEDDGELVKSDSSVPHSVLTQSALDSLQTPQDQNPDNLVDYWVKSLPSLENMEAADRAPKLPFQLFMPTRLIDVSSDEPYLMLRPKESIESDKRYAVLALSSDSLNVTTLENLEQRYRLSFSYGSYAIFKAAREARRLGIRYLWMPGVCVVQDDIYDSEREADMEQDIYSHAAYVWRSENEVPEGDDNLFECEANAYFGRTMRGP